MRYKPSNYHHYYTNETDILTKMKKGKDILSSPSFLRFKSKVNTPDFVLMYHFAGQSGFAV